MPPLLHPALAPRRRSPLSEKYARVTSGAVSRGGYPSTATRDAGHSHARERVCPGAEAYVARAYACVSEGRVSRGCCIGSRIIVVCQSNEATEPTEPTEPHARALSLFLC